MTHSIHIDNCQPHPLPHAIRSKLRECALCTLSRFALPKGADLAVSLVGEGDIQDTNRDFRGIDAVTDVLSFPTIEWKAGANGDFAHATSLDYHPSTGKLLLGDVIICWERAQQQAADYDHSLLRELCFLLVHGTLHCLGFDHETEHDDSIMNEIAQKILADCGVSRK